MMGPIIDPPLSPADPTSILKIIKMGVSLLKLLFVSPKKNETPDDVAARNMAFQLFCDQVRQETKQVEEIAIQQIEDYGAYLSNLSQSGNDTFFSHCQVSTRGMLRQLELLKVQIPGFISAEVSRRLSDSNAECRKIRCMLSGREKEVKMQVFLQDTLASAAEKCATFTGDILQILQNEFVADLQDCLDIFRRKLEKTEQELEKISASSNHLLERQTLRCKAQYLLECCNLIDEILC